jgi:hypothetical protein
MENYEYSQSRQNKNHPRTIAAKVGVVTGTAAMALSWAIDMRFIESSLTNSPGLLAISGLIGLLCVAVSVLHLRSA